MAADTITSPTGKTLLLRTAQITTSQEHDDAKVVQISSALQDCVCTLVLETNKFGDTLPIITTNSRTERNKVLYQQKIKALLTYKSDGRPMPNQRFSLKSNRHSDKIDSKGKTNTQGEITFVLVTREPGELELSPATAGTQCPSSQSSCSRHGSSHHSSLQAITYAMKKIFPESWSRAEG